MQIGIILLPKFIRPKEIAVQIDTPYNAVENAIFILKPRGNYSTNSPFLKVVAGTKEKWTNELSPLYEGVDAYIEANWEKAWVAAHGAIPANWLDVNWANSISANSIPYDGRTPFTRSEKEAVNAVCECELTLDILWAGVEGMGWRPTSRRIPSHSEILDFYRSFHSNNCEPFDATMLALQLTLYDKEDGLFISEDKAADLLNAALLDLDLLEKSAVQANNF